MLIKQKKKKNNCHSKILYQFSRERHMKLVKTFLRASNLPYVKTLKNGG